MAKVLARQIRGMGWSARIGLITIFTLLLSVFAYEGLYKPIFAGAATTIYNFNLDSSAVSLGADGSTNTASSSNGTGKFSMITTTPATRASNIGSNTLASGSAETTIGTIYGPAYATPQNLTSPALQLAVARNSSQSTETWKAYLYDYDPAGGAGNQVLLWTSGTATQNSSTASNVTLSLAGATQKTIAAGHRVKIVVVAYGTSGNTANLYARYSSSVYSAFTVTEASAGPSVASASPATGNPGQTLNVGITGNGFVSGATSSFGAGVTVNSTTYNSATSLTANVTIDPAATLGARTVTVTNPDTTNGSASIFSVISASAPAIASVTPSSIGQGASNVAIAVTGTNFNATSTLSCSNAGVTIATTYVDATHLTATVSVSQGATVGAANLTVTNSSDGSFSTSNGALTVTAAPTVTAAAPASGALGWTGNVVITGTGFQNGAAATFTGSGIAVNSTTYTSATSLTANVTVAANATLGAGKIQVTNPDRGVNVSAANLFTVVDPAVAPTITGLSTTTLGQGATAKTITVSGTNFVSGSAVSFSSGSISAVSTTFVNSTTLNVTLTVSTSASGTTNVTVTNPDTQAATLTSGITFTSRPGSSLSASPASGYAGVTGLDVTLTGSNFQTGAVATFANTGITVNSTTYLSATQVKANISIASNATSGAGSVAITNPDGGTRSVNSVFTVTPVAVFSADQAVAQGETTSVSITGQGFTAAATVAVSGTGVTVNGVTYVDANHLTVNLTVSPAATVGSRDVTVTVGSYSGTGTGILAVTAGPGIASLSPASVHQGDQNVDVTINGTNFQNGATVQLNGSGITLNSVTYVSATQLTANVSAGLSAAVGAQTLTITNPDGGKITGGSLSTVLNARTVSGAVSFTQITTNSISMVISYTGDGDNDGSCTIAYGATPSLELGSITALKGSGFYSATLSNLAGGANGTGKLYYIQVTYSDPDGVVGTNPISVTQPTRANKLIHNSQNTYSTKWAQGWGIEGGKYGAFTCVTCHNKNTGNIKMVAETITTPSLENWSSSGSNALVVNYLNPSTDLGNDSAHAVSTNVCEACHSRTGHHRYNNPSASHNGTTDCTVCHSHDEGFIPSCKTCHSTPQGAGGYRRQVVGNGGDFFTNMSGHGNLADLSSKTCTACHDATRHQDFSDGVSVALKNADTGASVVYDGTSATAAATAGACLSCHDADGATGMGVLALAPFTASGDYKAPTNINQYWPASNGAHATKMQCFNCHGNSKGIDGSTTNPRYNGHASGQNHVLQDKAFDVTNPNNYCFTCHKSTSTDPNKSFKNISGEFRLAYKHVTPRCFDCHGDESNATDSLHSLRAGSHIAGSPAVANNISNATGIDMSWSITSWGGASASTSLASNQVTAEYQVCFKCHGATGTGTSPAVNNSGYTGSGSLTNLALEFNPNNSSRHPVGTPLAAASQLLSTRLQGGWTPGMVMTCSDCHATDSTASKGPHGSSVKWMLAGTNKAWPYTSAASNGASTGTYFRLASYNTGAGTKDGLFCLNCHQVTGTNPFHTASGVTTGTHYNNANIPACVNCHLRVPHGGKIPRLLKTANAPARYKASGAADSVTLTTITGKGAGSPSGNFKCSSTTEHSGGTDAW
ncbi:hypothetical protein L4X63_03305 [Geomonas sp. Red32]|uniref:hypothetical protein n=1 Tax=Geomonas sp. Red32 TaxID=2912856 RepID=UPI00202CECF1|nr:hypothetical protein [Geomonas sp. Red32]MCM0080611.1 hypothetical protein [Geomonas sp. Red32]